MTVESCLSACWAACTSTAALPSWYSMTGITASVGGIRDSASALVCSFPAQHSTSKSNCCRYSYYPSRQTTTHILIEIVQGSEGVMVCG